MTETAAEQRFTFQDRFVMPRTGLAQFTLEDWRLWLQTGLRAIGQRPSLLIRAFAPVTLVAERGDEHTQLLAALEELPVDAQLAFAQATALTLETLNRHDDPEAIRFIALLAARNHPPTIQKALLAFLGRRLGLRGEARERVAVALAELAIARVGIADILVVARRMREAEADTTTSSSMLVAKALIDPDKGLDEVFEAVAPDLPVQLDPRSAGRRFLADQLVRQLGAEGCARRCFQTSGPLSSFLRETLTMHRLDMRPEKGFLVIQDRLSGRSEKLSWVPATRQTQDSSFAVAGIRFAFHAMDSANDAHASDPEDATDAILGQDLRTGAGGR